MHKKSCICAESVRYRWLRNGGWEVLQDPKYWQPELGFDGAIIAAMTEVAIDAATAPDPAPDIADAVMTTGADCPTCHQLLHTPDPAPACVCGGVETGRIDVSGNPETVCGCRPDPAAPDGDAAKHIETLKAVGSVFAGIPAPCDERDAINAAIAALTSQRQSEAKKVVVDYNYNGDPIYGDAPTAIPDGMVVDDYADLASKYVGPLLDAWEGADWDLKCDLRETELGKKLDALLAYMADPEPRP